MISYGGYNFPHPYPFVGEDLTSIVNSGSLDHFSCSVSLIGELTGCDIVSLKSQKDTLIHALSSGYQNLTFGSTGYDFAKPVSINFASSDLRKRVPYEIEFECYRQLDFTQFYGVKDPVDTWEFAEQGDRLVRATHTVSAAGVKVNTGSAFDNARSFVNARLNGFNNNLSLFFSGQTYILTSKKENINRIGGEYGISEDWLLSQSLNDLDTSGAIVRADCSIRYDPNESLSLSVRGDIQGGISGVVNTGYFTIADASEFAKNAVIRFKIPYEDTLYGDVLKDPLVFNYGVDSGSNNISFDFTFADPTDLRTGEIKHDYSSTISTSKDDPFSAVSVQGSVLYNSNEDIFTTNAPENETRWKKVDAYFSGVNPFPIAQQHFNWFKDSSLPYNQGDLNDVFTSFDITKTPHNSSIDYTYIYSNRPDFFSGLLRDVDLTIETIYPIPTYSISPTIDNSFGVQETYDTLERKNVSLSASLTSGVNFNTALNYVNSWILQYSGNGAVLLSDSLQTGSRAFSLSKSFIKP